MPKLAAWLGQDTRLRAWRTDDAYRASSLATIIAENAVSLVVFRRGAQLAAQTVRLDVLGGAAPETEGMGGNALVDRERVHILGYRNHPTEADTDLEPNDEFAVDGQYFRVIKVEIGLTDHLEALAEATQ